MATCAIVGASPEFNAEDFRARHEAGMFEFVIAVDAGFAYLEELGVKPDMAVGDFDSLGYIPKCRRVSRFPVKKDKSDMELALEKAVAWDYDDLVVYAALGGRLDHTIANLQLFAKFSEREDVYKRQAWCCSCTCSCRGSPRTAACSPTSTGCSAACAIRTSTCSRN